jgi:quinoprotein glucose dehydrogenase
LNKGTIKWKVPLGEVPELAAKGIRDTGFPFPKTGPVVTAGGLVFTVTRDHKVRAFDVETGKVLWEKRLATGMQGIPSVYQASGREFLVVCAAAPEITDTASQGRIHGACVAFALPVQAARSGEGDPSGPAVDGSTLPDGPKIEIENARGVSQ